MNDCNITIEFKFEDGSSSMEVEDDIFTIEIGREEHSSDLVLKVNPSLIDALKELKTKM